MKPNTHTKYFVQAGFLLLVLFGIITLAACNKTDKGYHENGTLKFEIENDTGKYNGTAVFYYNNGIKQHVFFYKID